METNRTGRRNVLRTAGAVAAAMQVNRHLGIPIVTTALALALAIDQDHQDPEAELRGLLAGL